MDASATVAKPRSRGTRFRRAALAVMVAMGVQSALAASTTLAQSCPYGSANHWVGPNTVTQAAWDAATNWSAGAKPSTVTFVCFSSAVVIDGVAANVNTVYAPPGTSLRDVSFTTWRQRLDDWTISGSSMFKSYWGPSLGEAGHLEISAGANVVLDNTSTEIPIGNNGNQTYYLAGSIRVRAGGNLTLTPAWISPGPSVRVDGGGSIVEGLYWMRTLEVYGTATFRGGGSASESALFGCVFTTCANVTSEPVPGGDDPVFGSFNGQVRVAGGARVQGPKIAGRPLLVDFGGLVSTQRLTMGAGSVSKGTITATIEAAVGAPVTLHGTTSLPAQLKSFGTGDGMLEVGSSSTLTISPAAGPPSNPNPPGRVKITNIGTTLVRGSVVSPALEIVNSGQLTFEKAASLSLERFTTTGTLSFDGDRTAQSPPGISVTGATAVLGGTMTAPSAAPGWYIVRGSVSGVFGPDSTCAIYNAIGARRC